MVAFQDVYSMDLDVTGSIRGSLNSYNSFEIYLQYDLILLSDLLCTV